MEGVQGRTKRIHLLTFILSRLLLLLLLLIWLLLIWLQLRVLGEENLLVFCGLTMACMQRRLAKHASLFV